MIKVKQTTIMRRLPNMSASRETVGIATALVSSVAVMSHDALDGEVSKIFGRSPTSGMISVCCSDTNVPHTLRMAMTAQVGARRARSGDRLPEDRDVVATEG